MYWYEPFAKQMKMIIGDASRGDKTSSRYRFEIIIEKKLDMLD